MENLQNPIITHMMETGTPDGRDAQYPHCPVCGAECSEIYRNKNREIVGCMCCLDLVDAWERPECFED